jgi:signal transduction histidine kinase
MSSLATSVPQAARHNEIAGFAGAASLGTLTASIAHEVNQPLSGIINNANACLRMLAADPPDIDGALAAARRTIRDGNRASDIVSRMRALFSKKHTISEDMDLNDVVREAIESSSADLEKNRAVVTLELAQDLPPVEGDPVQIQQVILNLLRNASDSMSMVDEHARRLLIRTERDHDGVRLAVQDTGIGLDREIADRLFEPYFTTKTSGMGIGLSVSRSIIEKHRGRIWAVPNDGPGATVWFSLPCKTEIATTGDGAHSAHTGIYAKKLVVRPC